MPTQGYSKDNHLISFIADGGKTTVISKYSEWINTNIEILE
jgi:hypothetical protein